MPAQNHSGREEDIDVLAEIAKQVFLIVSALFPIVDPPGGSPIFLSQTKGYSSDARRKLSRRIAVNSLFLLVGSYFIGTHVLAFFGISIPVVQVGGGAVVIASGWSMLRSSPRDEDPDAPARPRVTPKDPLQHAFYPLTFPLTVGPGSISVAITLGANDAPRAGFEIVPFVAGIVGAFLISASVYFCYVFADRLARRLGPTTLTVVTQLVAFLLICIGVQILWNGASALLASVHVKAG
jgi:multiple antibiotic resistance protein